MDYKRFLGSSEEIALPYLGGAFVETGSRRVRVEGEPREGWHRFRIQGRKAVAIAPADPGDLSSLPPRTGHFVPGGSAEALIACEDGSLEIVRLVPEDEPPVLAPIRARRWHDGALLFGEALFEAEVEEIVRRRLEDRSPIDDVRGIGASLRSAFGLALAFAIARERRVPLSSGEVKGRIHDIAARGAAGAIEIVDAILARRREYEEVGRAREEAARIERIARDASALAAEIARRSPHETPEERCGAALRHAGARFRGARRVANGGLEVRYDFLGTRFITIVDALTLRVRDAGICLDGADAALTLDSLPSAIREAVDTGSLVVTRH